MGILFAFRVPEFQREDIGLLGDCRLAIVGWHEHAFSHPGDERTQDLSVSTNDGVDGARARKRVKTGQA